PVWSPAVATGGNQWKIASHENCGNKRNPLPPAATGCRETFHGKEGVDAIVIAATPRLRAAQREEHERADGNQDRQAPRVKGQGTRGRRSKVRSSTPSP